MKRGQGEGERRVMARVVFSVLTSLISSSKAFSVGFIPMALIAQPSSFVLMFPPPSTSNSLKAWTNFVRNYPREGRGEAEDTDERNMGGIWEYGNMGGKWEEYGGMWVNMGIWGDLFEFSNLFLTQSLFTHCKATG